MQLESSPFPDAKLYTLVPWARSIESTENQIFVDTIKKEKNKTANIFHLLGWEAAVAVQRILNEGIASLKNYSFLSPRGMITFHPETHASYAPLYEGQIVRGENNNCKLALTRPVEVSAEAHRINHFTRPLGEYSRWKNNFFCI
jgi:branched-chain amino acid transport system substrate-binding protein